MNPNLMVFLKDLPRLKDQPCVINLDEYKLMISHWIAFYVNSDNGTYFHRFGVTHISRKIKKIKGEKISQQIFIEFKQMIQ